MIAIEVFIWMLFIPHGLKDVWKLLEKMFPFEWKAINSKRFQAFQQQTTWAGLAWLSQFFWIDGMFTLIATGLEISSFLDLELFKQDDTHSLARSLLAEWRQQNPLSVVLESTCDAEW